MLNTSFIKTITMLTLCLGLIAGGSVALAKKGLIYTQNSNFVASFSNNNAQFINIGAPGPDPTTLTFKTTKKKGQMVAVSVNAECDWSNAEGGEQALVRIYIDNSIVGHSFLDQCESRGSEPDEHVMYMQGAKKLDKGTHHLRVLVDPSLNPGADTLTIEDLTVMVLVQ